MTCLFPDSHVHVADIPGWRPVRNSPVCSCAHSPDEFARQEKAAAEFPGRVVQAFGIHPQKPDESGLAFLEGLLSDGRAAAIGEAGFDLCTPEFAADLARQEAVWRAQLELAERYSRPLVVHCRRALDRLYPFCARLARLPAVVFHSFPGSPAEAQGFLRRKVNAYFSLGKQLLNGNRRAALCAVNLPPDRLLLETDAPFQTLRGEAVTAAGDIVGIYAALARLRGESAERVCGYVTANFCSAFGVPS